MKGRITQDTIEAIKARLPVSAVVGKRVTLKRAGREWRALSPFTSERTPSFYVNDAKGFFHCFSSGKHGNIFDFEMEMSGCTFVDAVELLAGEAGVDVTREGLTQETEAAQRTRAAAGSLLECAQAFFLEHLRQDQSAIAYLRRREIRQRIAGRLGIGFAPAGGRQLLEHLADNGFSVQEAVAAGVATDPDEPGRAPRDFFRGRITFPIRSPNGRIQSFGGRIIAASTDGPKYLNGRETALFDKGRTLYGLDLARPAIAKEGVAIVLEGYMDVASVMQSGIENVVAPLGTALTVEHLHALWRVAPLIVYVSDGDAAGTKAGNRLIETALPWMAGDRRLTFGTMPKGVDPDDMVRTSGPAAFRSIVRGAQSTVDRLWQALRDETSGEGPEDRAKLEREIKERLAVVAEPEMRRAFTDELARRARRLGQARPHLGRTALERRIAPSIPVREAALVLAAVLHPEYLEQEIERFSELEVHAPLCAALRDVVLHASASGHHVQVEEISRDVALLRQALPHPEPSFVASVDIDGFRNALDVHGAQANRTRVRASFRVTV